MDSASPTEWIVTEWQAIQSNSANHPRTALIEATTDQCALNERLLRDRLERAKAAFLSTVESVDGKLRFRSTPLLPSMAYRADEGRVSRGG